MSDTFYLRQGKHKPKRVLKKDWIEEICLLLGKEPPRLDKCTIATLKQLSEGITKKCTTNT